MKVWLLMSRLAVGGLERVQVNLATELISRGIDVQLAAGQIVRPALDGVPDKVPIIQIVRGGPVLFSFGLLRALLRERPDIVFTTSNDVACILLILRAMFFRRIRVVSTQHLSISGPRLSAKGLKRIKLEFVRQAMKLLVWRAERVVAVSNAVAEDMRHELGFHALPIEVVYNPVVTPEFPALISKPIAWPWPDRSVPTVVFVGRLSAEKRVDLLISAIRLTLKETPARLLIVGSGPLEARIKSDIEQFELGSCCKLAGFQSNPLPWIHASDVLVLPSDFEGFGNVLVEAMACGVQVISTDCPDGPAEILDNGKYGQLVPRDDAILLAAAIHRALSKEFMIPPELLVSRAHTFTIEHATDAYFQIITSV